MSLEIAICKVVEDYAREHKCTIEEAKEVVKEASFKILKRGDTKNEK